MHEVQMQSTFMNIVKMQKSKKMKLLLKKIVIILCLRLYRSSSKIHTLN